MINTRSIAIGFTFRNKIDSLLNLKTCNENAILYVRKVKYILFFAFNIFIFECIDFFDELNNSSESKKIIGLLKSPL